MSAVKSEVMDQRFHHGGQNCTELREQLSEANNKISRTFMVCIFLFSHYNYIFTFSPDNCCSCPQEKAILSTQVLRLEKELQKLKEKTTGSLSDQENQVT